MTLSTTPELSIFGPQHAIPEEVDPMLATILRWPRPHMSFAELRFRAWLSAHINALLPTAEPVKYLAQGVMYAAIPMAGGQVSTTLFSCHIDTVDAAIEGAPQEGPDGGQAVKQKELMYDGNFGTIFVAKGSKVGTCLGADDGIGVWLMLKMMEAKVPGGYMFHTGEECGGIGSRAVLEKHMDYLKKYEVAIAFDRPRTNEVITHQGGLECASDKFANALCTRLNQHGFDYKPSRLGSFTDTKVYRGVIAECLNLGVGYENQHGPNETQDYSHATALLGALCAIDWSALPVDRDPSKRDEYPVYRGTYGSYNSVHGYGLDDDDAWGYQGRVFDPLAKKKAPKKKGNVSQFKPKMPAFEPMISAFDELTLLNKDDIEYMIADDPASTYVTIRDLLVEVGQLRSEVMVLRAMAGIK